MRYALHDELATGGMASVYFGRFEGPAGFGRVVAIKKLHPQFARDPDFVAMLLDEARMASRVRHPNVVATLDVIEDGAEILLAMEYVEGDALARLLQVARDASEKVPLEVAVAIAAGVLHGLHAAHEASTETGEKLELVHRDVSPQNVLVGVDGVPRLIDFGIAKAIGRSHVTREGQLRGKLPYMAPEQLRGDKVTRSCDVWGAAAVTWEMLTGRRLFDGDTEPRVYGQVMSAKIPAPSSVDPAIPAEVDSVVLRGLQRLPARRFATAREMALALEDCVRPATAAEVGVWVRRLAGPILAQRALRLAAIERELARTDAAPPRASPPSRRLPRWAAWIAAVLVALGLLGLGRLTSVWQIQRAAAVPVAAAEIEAPMPAPPQAAATSGVEAQPSPAVEELPGAPAPEASGTVAVDLPVGPSAERTPRAKPRVAPKRGPSRSPGSAGDRRPDACHTLDAQGVWHVRPECL